MARMNKAREEGWRNLMGSDDGDVSLCCGDML